MQIETAAGLLPAEVRVVLVMIPLTVLALDAKAEELKCHPVQGHAVTQVVPAPACTSPVAFCTAGKIFGTLKGDLSLTTTQFIPTRDATIPSVMFYVGQSVIRTKHGDTLVGTDAGALDLTDGTAASLITWIEGTGRFAGASGHIRVAPNLDRVTNTVFSLYWGEVCTPNKGSLE